MKLFFGARSKNKAKFLRFAETNDECQMFLFQKSTLIAAKVLPTDIHMLNHGARVEKQI